MTGSERPTRLQRDEVPRLYAIADHDTLGPERALDAVEAMFQAGVRWVQLRAKSASDREVLEWTRRVLERRPREARLWLNDRLHLAALLPVAGAHVGQDDVPPPLARRILGDEKWIGSSTHGRVQVAEAESDAAVDLVAIGPVFGTVSKANPDPRVGLDGVRSARGMTTKPLVAIGGIGLETAPAVIAAGADSVAVIGAVSGQNIERDCRRLLRTLS